MASTAVQLLPPPTHRSPTSTAGSASTPPPAAAASSSSRSSSATFSRSQSFTGLGGRPPRQKALSGPTKPAFLYTYSSSLAELAASGGDDDSGSAARTDGPDERPDYLRPSRAGHRLVQSRTMPLRGDGGLDSVAVGGDSGEVESGLPLRRSRKETLPADYWAKAKREPSAAGNTSPSATAALIRPGRRATTGARGAGPVSAGPSTSKSAAPTAPTLGRRPTIVEELEAKIVFLGSAGVGKTSIIRRFTTRKFGPTKTTVGSGLSTRKQVIDGVHVRLQLWDAAGQERYRSLAPMYYRGAHVAILVYDVTRRASFAELESWLGELREKGPSDVVIHVVGAKADLEGQREVECVASPGHERMSADEKALAFLLQPFDRSTRAPVLAQPLRGRFAQSHKRRDVCPSNAFPVGRRRRRGWERLLLRPDPTQEWRLDFGWLWHGPTNTAGRADVDDRWLR
jgi:small GTP-binding protein